MRRPDRRGASAIVLGLSLVVLLGVVALVVDLGYVRLVHAQLQAAADAAALAGAAQLDGTPDRAAAARAAAVDIAALNAANGEPVVITANEGNAPDGDVVLGRWDAEARSFVPELEPGEIDAVQVRASASELTAFFSRLAFGRQGLGAQAVSVAIAGGMRGAGRVPYYLPFGLPSCLWDQYGDETIMDMEFVLNPAGVDNTGWASVGSSANAAWLRDHLAALPACMEDYANTGEVSVSCAPASTSEEVHLGTGEVASALRAVAEAVENGVPWDSEVWGSLPAQHSKSSVDETRYGHVLEGPLPVFSASAEYCQGGGAWNSTETIDGFVWAVIYDVRAKGSAAQRNLWLRVDLSDVRELGTGGGGEDFGIQAPGPAVVVQ